MMQRILLSVATLVLVACSKPSGEPQAVTQPEAQPDAAPAAAPAASGDLCALVANPDATFGQPVTAGANSTPSGAVCEWKAADGRLCGHLTVFGPGYNNAAEAKVQYAGMTTSLKAFGETKDLSGIGEEAKIVDGGIFGAQVAFRTGTHAGLAASACTSGADKAPALAEKLAREVAAKL